ncbi:TrkA family potassium uptake protein [Clostridium sp. OS1-26]|uniref:potassium channel family protein n=1 Tax=Clostridium sp. OS1-26 TaxID=3070681 RepID=UPI0027E183C1|nr:TrkA family potassium uptake protein [Clostridium sp. OS1-26]WML36422.1 TrkA family potassium uptake protein [Clostridium sp. OS1-26]
MYIVIIGCGRLGSTLARELGKEHDIVVIDREESNLNRLGIGFNGKIVQGVEFDNDVLIEAGVNTADVVLAVTPDDNINIMALQTAKELFGVTNVMSRVSNLNMIPTYKSLGIEVVSPTRLAVDVIKTKIFNKGEMDIVALDNEMSIIQLFIKKNKLRVDYIEKKYECSICSIVRYGEVQLAEDDDVVYKGDSIICAIANKNKNKIIDDLAKEISI